MMMTKDEINQLAEQLSKVETEKKQHGKLVSYIFHGLTLISVALLSWLSSSFIQMKEDISNIKLGNQYVSAQMQSMDQFMEKPRFTQEDFARSTEGIYFRFERNEKLMDELRRDITDLRNEVKLLGIKIGTE